MQATSYSKKPEARLGQGRRHSGKGPTISPLIDTVLQRSADTCPCDGGCPNCLSSQSTRSPATVSLQEPQSQPVTTPPATPTTPTPAPAPAPQRRRQRCRVTNPVMGLRGGTVNLQRGTEVAIHAGGTQSNLGMLFLSMVNMRPRRCGRLLYVQNVKVNRSMIFKDNSKLVWAVSSWHLDTSNPYPSQNFPTRTRGQVGRMTNDSPVQGTGRIGTLQFTEGMIRTLAISDQFRMFLLYQPRRSRRRRTLLAADWMFKGLARNNSTRLGRGQLVLDTNRSSITPATGLGAATTNNPVITPNITSTQFQIHRGGGATGNTFADVFVTVLNGRRRTP